MDALQTALTDAGGLHAGREYAGQLRRLLTAALADGAAELARARSGYERPVTVAFAAATPPLGTGLVVALPVDPALRADPHAVEDRALVLTAAAVGALVEVGATAPPAAGRLDDHLVLHAPGAGDPELAALAFEDQVAGVDRLRARALALPAAVLEALEDVREPIGAGHPLLVAHQVAAHGGRPADPDSVAEHEEAVLAVLDLQHPGVARPHDDPDPARRAARRIHQRLAGMGKWGGFHTEFQHLSRGFAPSDRGLANRTGEALLAAGLLLEKPSVGQRHVFLNPARAAEIHALVDDGIVPADLDLG